MAESELNLNYVCDYYLNIADQLISTIQKELFQKKLQIENYFSLLSDFYLNTTN